MGKADVLLTQAIDCNMPCNARKRIHCWGSAASQPAGASRRKKWTVEGADGEPTRRHCTGSASGSTDDDIVYESNVLSSNEESAFTQGSRTGGVLSEHRSPFVGLDGYQLEEICEARAENSPLDVERSEKPEEVDGWNHCEVSSSCTPDEKATPRQPKTAHPNGWISNVRALLSTGLLEGLPVKYCFDKYKVENPGIIHDLGYLCGCCSCNYTKVLSGLEFERHSGATSKNQNNHIFLKSGKTLYNVVKELTKFRLNSLENVIESVIGCPPNWGCYKEWKESLQIENHEVQATDQDMDAKKHSQPEVHYNGQIAASFSEQTQESCICSDLISEVQERPVMINNIPENSYRGCSRDSDNISSFHYGTEEAALEENHFFSTPGHLQNFPFQERNTVSHTSKGRKRATRMSTSPDFCHMLDATMQPNIKPNSSSQVCAKKRVSDLHRLIFLENGLPDGAELAYCVKGQKVLMGYKLGNGIACSCCQKEISPSQFEVHAGCATRRQPYRHIFTSNGVSLHDLSISLSKGQHLTAVHSDNECSVCGDGGQLILCARCPKAFHIVCLGLEHAPDGEWYCTYCRDEVLSGTVSTDAQMTVRVRRVIVPSTLETSCCSICRGSNFSCSDSFNDETVLICDQCEKEYHVGCLRTSGLCNLQVLPEGNWFCCSNCVAIHASLKNIISDEEKVVPEVLLNQLTMKLQESGFTNEPGFDVRWQLLSRKNRSSENKVLLSRAFEIFRKGFDPIKDRSGSDLLPAIVYGRNMGGHEFGGMYCVILTVKSVVVSAAILRVFGNEAAEMPLVATSQERQGKGYFGCLFSCIEMLLRSLNVETLVLPAAENAETMWIHKFGFKKMADERIRKFAETLPLMMFGGTKMLEKHVLQASTLVEQAP